MAKTLDEIIAERRAAKEQSPWNRAKAIGSDAWGLATSKDNFVGNAVKETRNRMDRTAKSYDEEGKPNRARLARLTGAAVSLAAPQSLADAAGTFLPAAKYSSMYKGGKKVVAAVKGAKKAKEVVEKGTKFPMFSKIYGAAKAGLSKEGKFSRAIASGAGKAKEAGKKAVASGKKVAEKTGEKIHQANMKRKYIKPEMTKRTIKEATPIREARISKLTKKAK